MSRISDTEELYSPTGFYHNVTELDDVSSRRLRKKSKSKYMFSKQNE